MPETYRYAAVEAALASMFFIEPESMGAFRGRITNLRKFGVTPAAPRKGAHVEYTFNQVALLAYCISLLEIGIDPSSIVGYISLTYEKVEPYLLHVSEIDMILCFNGNAMTRVFANNTGSGALISSVVLPAHQATYEEVARRFTPSNPAVASPATRFLGSRLCMVNLSHIRRSLVAALSA